MKERGNTVLVVDGGARGTVLVHKYSQSPHIDRIVAIPGNDWMLKVSKKPVQIFPKILAKKSEAFGLRMLVKKPIFAAWNGEISLCSSEKSAFCVSTLIKNVLIPRYAKYPTPKNLMILEAIGDAEMRSAIPVTEYVM